PPQRKRGIPLTSTGRRTRRKAKLIAVAAAGVMAAGAAAIVLPGTAQAASLAAVYTKTADWSGGYTAQYVISNDSDRALSDWTLEFDLPEGARIGSLWNGRHTVDGRHITVTPESWNSTVAAGRSVSVGFVVMTDRDR